MLITKQHFTIQYTLITLEFHTFQKKFKKNHRKQKYYNKYL